MSVLKNLKVMQNIVGELNEETVIAATYNAILEKCEIQLDSVQEVNKFDNVKVSFLDEGLKFPFEHYTYVDGVKIFALSEDALCLVKQ